MSPVSQYLMRDVDHNIHQSGAFRLEGENLFDTVVTYRVSDFKGVEYISFHVEGYRKTPRGTQFIYFNGSTKYGSLELEDKPISPGFVQGVKKDESGSWRKTYDLSESKVLELWHQIVPLAFAQIQANKLCDEHRAMRIEMELENRNSFLKMYQQRAEAALRGVANQQWAINEYREALAQLRPAEQSA